jgi:hypothetical protein
MARSLAVEPINGSGSRGLSLSLSLTDGDGDRYGNGDRDMNDSERVLTARDRPNGMPSCQRLDVYRCAIDLLAMTATMELLSIPTALYPSFDRNLAPAGATAR